MERLARRNISIFVGPLKIWVNNFSFWVSVRIIDLCFIIKGVSIRCILRKGKATIPLDFVNKQNIVAEIEKTWDWRRIPAEQDEKKVGTQFKSNEQFLNILLPPRAAFWQRCTEYGIPLIQNFEVGKMKMHNVSQFYKITASPEWNYRGRTGTRRWWRCNSSQQGRPRLCFRNPLPSDWGEPDNRKMF